MADSGDAERKAPSGSSGHRRRGIADSEKERLLIGGVVALVILYLVYMSAEEKEKKAPEAFTGYSTGSGNWQFAGNNPGWAVGSQAGGGLLDSGSGDWAPMRVRPFHDYSPAPPPWGYAPPQPAAGHVGIGSMCSMASQAAEDELRMAHALGSVRPCCN
jgi:hypothetical protein